MKLYLSILLLLSSAVGHAAQDSALPSNFQIYISQGFTLVPRAVFKSPCFRLYVDGKAVGDLRWSKLNDTDIQIDSLYVVPEFRRHGYANVLLEYGLTVLAKDFKKAVLKVHPFERVDDKVTGMWDTHPNRDKTLPKLRTYYFKRAFRPTADKDIMERTLVTHAQIIASVKPACLQVIPNTFS